MPGDPERIVDAPPIGSRKQPDERLRAVLDGLLADPQDGRGAMRAAVASWPISSIAGWSSWKLGTTAGPGSWLRPAPPEMTRRRPP
jgi:hypothetical protein